MDNELTDSLNSNKTPVDNTYTIVNTVFADLVTFIMMLFILLFVLIYNEDKTEDFIGFVFGPSMRKRMKLHKYYLSVRDKNYLDWALHNFFQWNREEADPDVIHIHGSHDALFPVSNLKNYISVPGGTHALILIKAPWLNKHLPELISK